MRHFIQFDAIIFILFCRNCFYRNGFFRFRFYCVFANDTENPFATKRMCKNLWNKNASNNQTQKKITFCMEKFVLFGMMYIFYIDKCAQCKYVRKMRKWNQISVMCSIISMFHFMKISRFNFDRSLSNSFEFMLKKKHFLIALVAFQFVHFFD